ncbi:MAG: hypothetical protein JW984_10205 [Deltaproteobacteria bacterium]|uniref:Uncharacterized protein n=1 Tax=Candidatus Zymogenus saltonus TaxID=2844893 RepID=A0A9D8KGD3_9DELT|nr:hypothetical protein [Candidatus Zymogenus saltonus]
MTIDIHGRLVDERFFAEVYWRGFAKMALPIIKRMDVDADVDTVVKDIFPVCFDKDGRKHVAAIKEAGIDKTVLLPFDTGLLFGEGEVSIEERNEMVFSAAKSTGTG